MTQPKKTIQIILSSSDDVAIDRNTFSNLIRKLDRIYERRGIRIKLIEHSDEFAPNSEELEKYNSQVKASDIFVALFYLNAGKLTIREFNTASDEFLKTNKSPKVYVFCKNLQEGESASKELEDFKQLLYQELGHYWINYNNDDSIQFEFVMQLLHIENDLDSLKLEDGEIKLDGESIVKMDKLQFATAEFNKFQSKLDYLSEEINDAQLNITEYPDNKRFKDKLQKYLNEYNNLKEEFVKHQELIFNTAKHIAQLYGRKITDRMHRAIEAFNKGDVLEAKTLLKEVLHDANQIHSQLRQSKELYEQCKQNAINLIEELSLNASILLTDNSIPIEERIFEAKVRYKKADEIALDADYEKEKHADLLTKYSSFLSKFAFYDESEKILQRLIKLNENLYGYNPKTATSYNNIGCVYDHQDKYDLALEFHNKALEVHRNILGENHTHTATSYNNIGLIYNHQDKYDLALEFYYKALEIHRNILGENHTDTATSYNNIGAVYANQDKYDLALDLYHKALEIRKNILGENHTDTATSYNNIGVVYDDQGKYDLALEFYNKALDIYRNIFGKKHPNTATSYNNIGAVYKSQGKYDLALEFFNKALEIRKNILGENHTDTATSYNNIGAVYDDQGKYNLALEFYNKALEIRKNILGENHTDTATSYNTIGFVYSSQGKYDLALEFYNKALEIRKNILGENHTDTATSYNNIGAVYSNQSKYDLALEFYNKALEIRKNVIGENNTDTATSYNNIGNVYYNQDEYVLALEFYNKALEIRRNILGENHTKTANSYNNIGNVYYNQDEYNLALEFFNKAYNIYVNIFGENHSKTLNTKKLINEIKQLKL